MTGKQIGAGFVAVAALAVAAAADEDAADSVARGSPERCVRRRA